MKNMKSLLLWGKKYWLWIFLSLFFTVSLQFLYSYVPLFVQYTFNVLGDGGKTNLPFFIENFLSKGGTVIETVLYICICIMGLQFFRLLIRFIDSYIKGMLTENIARDMRIKLYGHIQNLSFEFHNHSDNGDLIQRCTSDIDTSSGFLSNKIPEFVSIIAAISIGAYRVGSINLTIMLVSMIIIPISGISSIIYFRYVNKTFDKIEKSESKMTTIIEENLVASRVVRAFNNEKYEIDKMDIQSKDYTNKNIKFNRAMALYWGISDFAVTIQYTITLVVGIHLAKEGIVNAADISACLMLMGMLVWPIRGLGRLIGEFGKTNVAIGRIDEILNEPSEFDLGGLKPKISGNIEFKNVSFRFTDSNETLLNNVSFKINSGETVAIIGKTGSGKSTIANILTRLLDYSSGEILVDGVLLEKIDKKHLRKNIGVVLQSPFLYSKTIYENIAIAGEETPIEKVREASDIALLSREINKFEKGYNTVVGEKGTTLSGGQKQRMAIARMLVEDKAVIIFDDSLSAVDTETDMLIRKQLEKTKLRTKIIITHRITTAKEADKIIVLENGKISEIGNHDTLINKEGLYKKLWAIQGGLEMEFLENNLGGENDE